jgi:hypothetical protein
MEFQDAPIAAYPIHGGVRMVLILVRSIARSVGEMGEENPCSSKILRTASRRRSTLCQILGGR